MSAVYRLGPSAAPKAWTGFVLSNACCTAVLSRTGIAASMPSMTRSPAATCSGRLGARSVRTGAHRASMASPSATSSSRGWVSSSMSSPSSCAPEPTGRGRCGGCTSRSRAGQVSSGDSTSPACPTEWRRQRGRARADLRSRLPPLQLGFRPGLSAHHALETVRTTVNRGKVWVLDADIRSCFDEIDSHALVVQIERRVCDRRMLKLIRGWLRAGVFEGGIVSAIEAGTPQGSPMTAPTQSRTSSLSVRFGGR